MYYAGPVKMRASGACAAYEGSAGSMTKGQFPGVSTVPALGGRSSWGNCG